MICTIVFHGCGSMSSGNMWPEKKKLNSMYTNSSELTSRNQKPIMPIVASRKKPSRNDKTSDDDEREHHVRRRPAGEVAAAQIEHERERHERDAVVHELVGDAHQQQKADQIDRLNEIFLDLAVANLQGDAAGQARHAGKRPADHRQQVVGDEIVVAVAGDLLRRRRRCVACIPANTAPHRKICVTIGRNRISVPSQKSPR